MEKSADAFRTIGEMAEELGVRTHILRYWEEQFPTLNPLKRSGGRRYYRPEDVRLLATIDRLVHQEGYTLRGARLAIEGNGSSDAKAQAMPVASPAAAPQLGDDVTPRLRAIRDALAQALAAA